MANVSTGMGLYQPRPTINFIATKALGRAISLLNEEKPATQNKVFLMASLLDATPGGQRETPCRTQAGSPSDGQADYSIEL